MKIPEQLEIITGKTLGERMEYLTSYLNNTAARIRSLEFDLYRKWTPINDHEHKRRRGMIDEHYERWTACFEAMLETSIGDWIRGTHLWNDFWNAGSDLHEEMMKLIETEHSLS